MIWVDREAQKIKKNSVHNRAWADDMKTPSGRVHVGALRGVVIHDLIYKVLKENDVDAHYSYVINDYDQMDAIPSYLDREKWEKYAGMPLSNIPSPDPEYKSFGEYYAKEFIEVFESINCHPEIFWGSEFYKSGKMDKTIKIALDNAGRIREIYERFSKKKRPDDWLPFQPICEKCGKIGTTYAYKWDGEKVWYRCSHDMVKWAKGCGYEGKVSPFKGNGKLHWKVDWPALWSIIGVTVESSGKDHMSHGGSYDVSSAISREVFDYDPPYAMGGYEWFTVGGRKMSSSKGIGSSAREVAAILPPELLRFLIVRTPIERHLDFDPFGDTIPNLFDDYDKCMGAYFDRLEGKIPEGKQGEVLSDFARILELSEVRKLPDKRIFIPRFRTIVNLIKTKTDIKSFFEKQKGFALTPDEKEMLEERIVFAEVYLKKYAGDDVKIQIIEQLPEGLKLTEDQKTFLKRLGGKLSDVKSKDRDAIQDVVFSSLKENSLKPREVFSALYQILIGRDAGPKAADLILDFGVDKVSKRINEALNDTGRKQSSQKKFSVWNHPEIFSIDPALAKSIPSITIGIAVIKNVSVKKSDPELQKEINTFLDSIRGLSNEDIGSYPEIQSYRKLYKQMGIDWHSRRPSPEALLRRVALKKGLYSINTCVDAYNLVVMKNRVSSGAFDLDKITLPTVLRYARSGEDILLLGDREPTKYTEKEIAYFDKKGGYNIDFNYRDAQRSAVSEETKNLLINIDGVFDISSEAVERTLDQTIAIIQKYCGGTLEVRGIIYAHV